MCSTAKDFEVLEVLLENFPRALPCRRRLYVLATNTSVPFVFTHPRTARRACRPPAAARPSAPAVPRVPAAAAVEPNRAARQIACATAVTAAALRLPACHLACL